MTDKTFAGWARIVDLTAPPGNMGFSIEAEPRPVVAFPTPEARDQALALLREIGFNHECSTACHHRIVCIHERARALFREPV